VNELYSLFGKRLFDVLFSIVGLVVFWWVILLAFILVKLETRGKGFYLQKRIGKKGDTFTVIKLRTMDSESKNSNTITSSNDSRITKVGAFLRRSKIDELPQLFNVLIGNMSFVGPRPDVPGYADTLSDDDRIILSVKPGITGPATIHFKNEENILSKQEDPKRYNDEVIFPLKVKINKKYVKTYSLRKDVMYIIKTILG
jgi:lipopolysaccharide/colanic/teichoic acid biosynthesis glycosyltransferase